MDQFRDLLPGRRKEQILSPFETARQVREGVVQALLYGVHGKSEAFGNPDHRGVSLKQLLGYTEQTSKLQEGIRTTLLDPTQDSILSARLLNGRFEINPEEGDAVYFSENGTHSFHFDTGYFYPGVSHQEAPSTFLGIVGHPDGVWMQAFGQSKLSSIERIRRRHETDEERLEAHKRNIGTHADLHRPDRQLLLNLLFVPQNVDVVEALKRDGFSEKTGAFVYLDKKREVEGYDVYTFGFDARKFIEHGTRQPGFYQVALLGAREWDPKTRIQAVVIGQVEIGNVTYKAVTGAERPLVKERQYVGVGKTVKKPVLAPIRVRRD